MSKEQWLSEALKGLNEVMSALDELIVGEGDTFEEAVERLQDEAEALFKGIKALKEGRA